MEEDEEAGDRVGMYLETDREHAMYPSFSEWYMGMVLKLLGASIVNVDEEYKNMSNAGLESHLKTDRKALMIGRVRHEQNFTMDFALNYKGVARKGHGKILFAPDTIKNFMDLEGF